MNQSTTQKPSITVNEIKAFRKSLGFTQQQLADEWGVDRATINNYEGRGNLPLPRPKMVGILVDWTRMNESMKEAQRLKQQCADDIAAARINQVLETPI